MLTLAAYTAPLPAMDAAVLTPPDAHPLLALASAALVILTGALWFAHIATAPDYPVPIPRPVPALTAPASAIMRGGNPVAVAMQGCDEAPVWCEGTKRWRHPRNKRFVKVP